jgi:hypothetical protein
MNEGGWVVDRDAAERARGLDGRREVAPGSTGVLATGPFAVEDVHVPNGDGRGSAWPEDGHPGSQGRRARLGVVERDTRTDYAWRIEDVLPDGAYAFIYGKFGSFKSLVSVDLAQRVSRGMSLTWGPDGPSRIVQAPVLYVAAEDYAGIEMRRRAWESYYGVEETGLLEFIRYPVNLLDDEKIYDLAEYVLERQHKLVVIDTLHRSMGGGSEVSDVDTAAITAAVARIQGAYYPTPADVPVDPTTEREVFIDAQGREVKGSQDHVRVEHRYDNLPHQSGRPAVWIAHHPNQRSNTLRGHGGFYGDSDTIFRTTRKKDEAELYCEKQKNGPDGWSLRFEFVEVDKSGVVVPVEERETSRGSNASEANHIRWHVRREVVKEDCEFCVTEHGGGS